MERIDIYPTHEFSGFKLRAGSPIPFGATIVPGGINFAVFSSYASDCTLVLFEREQNTPLVEIPFPDEFRIGNVFAMVVFDLNYENIEYGYRMNGPWDPTNGHRFDSTTILSDPYAKAISGRNVWGEPPDPRNIYQLRSKVIQSDFDWEHDRPLEIPIEDLVIYEMHVNAFTHHPSAGVRYPGTFAAIREKIPYLKSLGVNCVELMPIFEFDEFENSRINAETGEPLIKYWGYGTIGFFAPKAGYAATGPLGMQADEFKALIKDLHQIGIEVILDVVFNHTGEGNELGPTISFRGLDNKTYYMLSPDGSYLNYSGTGNTMNCSNPVVRGMVLDCLRYWAAEYHIDGFRFDLASILGRDQNGVPLPNPPLLETLAFDPILAKCKLIAEAWDAGGLYQVGSFPAYGRWAEWNGKYRDTIRRFIKGDIGQVGEMAQRLVGSPDLYGERGTTASINFVTCHDGFTLHDLVSYNSKHNLANGENNQDGANDNYSWNCGVEGQTTNRAINALRRRQMKNAIAILLCSHGVPMIMMGDEVAHTKYGNNNTYCHDNELNWMNWSHLQTNHDIFRFFKNCIEFRKQHPILRGKTQNHFEVNNYNRSIDVSWHGVHPWQPDWSEHSRTLAVMFHGETQTKSEYTSDIIYIAMNMFWEELTFYLPHLPHKSRWHIFANTGKRPPYDIYDVNKERPLSNQNYIKLLPRSVLILVAKPWSNPD